MWFGLGKASGDGLASIQRDMALQSLRAAGLSKQAATLVVDAGYSSAAALRAAPWTAEEAGGLHQSAEWRLTTTVGSTASLLGEVQSFREANLRARDRVAQTPAAPVTPAAPAPPVAPVDSAPETPVEDVPRAES